MAVVLCNCPRGNAGAHWQSLILVGGNRDGKLELSAPDSSESLSGWAEARNVLRLVRQAGEYSYEPILP